MADRPIFPGAIANAGLDIENADGTTVQALITGGTNGTRVNSISITSTDTSAVILDVFFYDGSSDFQIGTVTIPIGAGTDAGTTPAVSLLNQTNLPFLGEDLSYYLADTEAIRLAPQSAVTAATKVACVANCGTY